MTQHPDVAVLLDHFGSGGVERVACLVANGLAARGFRVEMVVLRAEGPARALLNPAVTVEEVGRGVGGRRRGTRMRAAVPAVAAYLERRQPALFHAPGNHTIRPAAAAVRSARFTGVFVAKVTNPLVGDRLASWQLAWRRCAFGRALRRADRVLVLSSAGIEEVAAVSSALRERCQVVCNPYISSAMLARSAERAPVSPPVILSVGRLHEQKNQALLLRAAARLKERDWRVRLCGTGPDEAVLRALVAELGIADRVEFAGFIPDPLPEYLAATVLAQSSRWEGLPATVLEAIACGCPVVATASSPALVDLLREVGGRRPVPVSDEVAFAAALAEALDGRAPAVRPEAALPYGIEASLDEHATLFRELLGR